MSSLVTSTDPISSGRSSRRRRMSQGASIHAHDRTVRIEYDGERGGQRIEIGEKIDRRWPQTGPETTAKVLLDARRCAAIPARSSCAISTSSGLIAVRFSTPLRREVHGP